MLPVKHLPLLQRWTCHGCTTCCRRSVICLNGDDLRRLEEQAWDQREEYRGTRIVVREGWFCRRVRLARRSNGDCIFLMADGRCRIHAEHGAAAKPLVCRSFPLQLVPLGDFAYLSLRRSCPSAAAMQGEEVDRDRPDLRRTIEEQSASLRPNRPPPILSGGRRWWKAFFLAAEAMERILLDNRYPLVRRLAHGLKFCDDLEHCRLGRLGADRLAELIAVLESSAAEGVSHWFADRLPPSAAAGMVFRQTVLEYVSLHPKFGATESLRQRLRMARAAWAFARGKGRMPPILFGVPQTGLETLDCPLGPLDRDVLFPLETYFEASAVSKQYAILNRRGWSLVESFRALALAYPVALAMLRLTCGEGPPQADQAIDAIGAIDRAQGNASLSGARHRRRLRQLASLGELPRLLAWYAR
jgi:Fe-S-cluster containining protein